MAAEKRCNECGELKPVNEFYADSAARDGRRPECKLCTAARRSRWYRENKDREIARVRNWQRENWDRHLETQRQRRQRPEVKARERAGHLRRTYGITLEEYDALLDQQGGVCAICRRPPRDDISLHVDHDHATGAVRGLLCFRCNNAVGDLDDDATVLRRAAAYVDVPEPEQVERARARARALVTARR